jgi:hypothetical protein
MPENGHNDQTFSAYGLTNKTILWLKAMYEVISKIFRTGAAIYTAVVLAQSTGSW